MNLDPGCPTLILRLHILGLALLPVAWPRPKGGLSERLMQVGLLPASSKTSFSFFMAVKQAKEALITGNKKKRCAIHSYVFKVGDIEALFF
jgi:hypothetical protein